MNEEKNNETLIQSDEEFVADFCKWNMKHGASVKDVKKLYQGLSKQFKESKSECKHPAIWEIQGENLCKECGKVFSESELNVLNKTNYNKR